MRQSAGSCATRAQSSERHVSIPDAAPVRAGTYPGSGSGAELADVPELLSRHRHELAPPKSLRQRNASREPAQRQRAVEAVSRVLASVAAEAEGGQEGARLRRNVGEALSACPDLLTHHDLCSVLKQQSNPHVAMGLFEWAKGRPSYRPHTFVYTALIGVLGAAGEVDLVGRVHDEMKAAGCEHDIYSFGRLLHAYARNNMVEKALAVYGELQAAGLAPNRVFYGILSGMWRQAGRPDRVIQVFEEMRAAKIEPDAIDYTDLLSACKRMGHRLEGAGHYHRMLAQGLKPDVVLYTAYIDMHAKEGDSRTAIAMFHEMREDGVAPSVRTYNTLIHLCGKDGTYEEAEKLFAEMQAAGHAPTEIMWSTLIHMWGRAGDAGRAAHYFHRMIEAGVPPGEPAFNALVFARLRAGMVREVRTAVGLMLAAGKGPSLQTYSLLLSHAIDCVNQADLGVLLELLEASEQPLHAVLVKLLQEPAAAALEGELEAAVAGALAALPPSVDARAKRSFAGTAIDFLCKYGCKARASMLWSQARRCNIFPSVLTYSQQSPEGRWKLNLHGTSPGTAAIVMLTELRRLRSVVLGGGPFPGHVEIITGGGRRSRVQGQSPVKQEVVRLLEGLGSPFREDNQNSGLLFAPAAAVRKWLRQPHLEAGLALHNTILRD